MFSNVDIVAKEITRKWVVFFTLIFAFASLFISFHSRSYTTVDGSIRSVAVFYSNRPYIHTNNHMLFPIHVYYFNKALKVIGIESRDTFEYFRNSSFLNAVAGSIALGIFFLILVLLTGNYFWSVLGVLIVGFSKAYLVNATNPNEPMVGFLFSILSSWLFILSIVRKKFFYSCLSGLFLSYATATYQSMLSIFPVFVLVYAFFVVISREDRKAYLKVLFSFVLSLLIGFIVIYGICYSIFYHVRSVPDFTSRFFQVGEHIVKGIWGEISLKNLFMMSFGAVYSLFELPFTGVRRTFLSGVYTYQIYLQWASAAMLVVVVWALVCIAWVKLVRYDKAFLRPLLAMLSFVIFSSFCAYYLAIFHSKLWLQPIATFVALAIYAVANYAKLNYSPKTKRLTRVCLMGFVVALILWNGKSVLIRNHEGESNILEIARSVDQMTEEDSLIFHDWDKTSLVFGTFFKDRRSIFDVPWNAVTPSKNRLIDVMDQKIREASERNQSVYFLGVLSTTKETWEALQGKAGVTYESFQKYRDHAILIKKFKIGQEELSLYKINQ